MRFCIKCDRRLIKTKFDYKCPKCDSLELSDSSNFKKHKVKPELAPWVPGKPFPFEKNQYYVQKDIRVVLKCSLMHGINYNREGNFLVVFMNVHKNSPTAQSNPYHDYYDPETKSYHYVARGRKGNQEL